MFFRVRFCQLLLATQRIPLLLTCAGESKVTVGYRHFHQFSITGFTIKMVVPMAGKRESMRIGVSMVRFGQGGTRAQLCHSRSDGDEDVALRLGQDVLGRAAEQEFLEHPFAMLTDDDQVAIRLLFLLQDAQ